MSKSLKALRDRRAEVISNGRAAMAAVDGTMTEEQREELRGIKAEQDLLDAQISAMEEQAELERAFAPDGDGRVSGGTPMIEQDPQRGFASLGEFAMAVRAAGDKSRPLIDERLVIGAAPTTTANEGSGADGGYLIPPAFSNRIHALSLEEGAFLPMTDNITVGGNSMAFPRDETTPWGSNGIRAYWEAEGALATQTKPVLGRDELRLSKLFALVPMTDELLSDATALGAYVERKAGESIRWKTNDALVNGTGAGQPLGIVNSACVVTQAKEGSQAADTILAANVAKMYARNLNPGRAVWLINPDAFNQLVTMTIGDQPIFTGPSIAGAPGGMLLGRPVILTDTCQTLGDLNDIQFVDWSAYVTITKAGGVQTATSMHLWFDYDVMAFRAIFRVDGHPWLSAPVTPPNSATTRSCIVNLAARA